MSKFLERSGLHVKNGGRGWDSAANVLAQPTEIRLINPCLDPNSVEKRPAHWAVFECFRPTLCVPVEPRSLFGSGAFSGSGALSGSGAFLG